MPPKNSPGGGGKGGKDQTILGSNRDDFLIIGTGGDDTIDARGGDDIIEGSLGNDSIDGGSGTQDFLIYTFPVDDLGVDGDDGDYLVSRIESGGTVTYEITYEVNGVSYTDTVTNVEYIVFGDGSVLDTVNNILDPGDPPGDPTPVETIDFDTLTPISWQSTEIDWITWSFKTYDAYQSAEGYVVLQMTTGGTGGYEDIQTLQDQDPSDVDFEFRVWTGGDGTTHEMAVIDAGIGAFTVQGVTLSGLETGDIVEVYSYDGLGNSSSVYLEVTAGDVQNGYLDLTSIDGFDNTDITQFSLVAVNEGGEFFVDDLIIV